MAHLAEVLTMEEAHWRVMSKITEVERFLQERRTTVGPLHPEQWTEAGNLHRKLAQRLSLLKILWHAEPDEARFHGMREWITVIEDEVYTKLGAMEVFMRTKENWFVDTRAGGQTTHGPADGGVVPLRKEATTPIAARLNVDTVEGRMTLTQQTGDTGKPQETLCPKDMSRLVATPTGRKLKEALHPRDMSRLVATPMGQFNQHVGHLGEAGTVIGQQKTKRRTQAGGHHIPSLMDVQVTGVNLTESTCWPPVGRCASCGEGYRRFQACLARGSWCGQCGLRGHFTRMCMKEMNLHMARDMHHEGTAHKLGRHWKSAEVNQNTKAPGPSRGGKRARKTNTGRDVRCLKAIKLSDSTPCRETDVRGNPEQRHGGRTNIDPTTVTQKGRKGSFELSAVAPGPRSKGEGETKTDVQKGAYSQLWIAPTPVTPILPPITTNTEERTLTEYQYESLQSPFGANEVRGIQLPSHELVISSELAQGGYGPYVWGVDDNEHRKRKRGFDFNINSTTTRQAATWIAEDPVRLANARHDITEWMEHLTKATRNPAFPLFMSLAYGNQGPQ